MKILVTEKPVIDIGDMDWSSLESLSNDIIFLEGELTTANASEYADVEIIVVNKTAVTEDLLDMLPSVRGVFEAATGTNNIDIPACSRRNIAVYNVKGYSTSAVVQMLMAHLLSYINQINYYDGAVKMGRWTSSTGFCFLDSSYDEISSLSMGIVGYGSIGRQLADVLKAFGCKVKFFSSHQNEGDQFVSFDQLLQNSDVLFLCTSLNEKNAGLIDASAFKKMKNSAILVNASRGGLINENDLYEALIQGQIKAALLDVLTEEPPLRSPLFKLENCIITPHIAWAAEQSRQRLIEGIASNIQNFSQEGGTTALNYQDLTI